jgi:hypothetical protein
MLLGSGERKVLDNPKCRGIDVASLNVEVWKY